MKKYSFNAQHSGSFLNSRSKKLIWILMLLPVFLSIDYEAWAGGIWIHPDKIFLNDEIYSDDNLQERWFEATIPIEMKFSFDKFRWSEKDYEYVIFQIFKESAKKYSKPIGYFAKRISRDQLRTNVEFDLPDPKTSYEIKYHVATYFTDFRLRSGKFGGFLSLEDIEQIKNFYKNPDNAEYIEHLIFLRTNGVQNNVNNKNKKNFKKHISLDFQNPTKIKSDLEKRSALNFQWKIVQRSSKLPKNVKYSYRLDPIEEWSLYSKSQKATYNFLRPGNYTFQVKAKYTIGNMEEESKIATYNIQVRKKIFSLSTKEVTSQNEIPAEFFKNEHYKRNKALLIGVTEYDDKASFVPLHFVNEDIKIFTNALKKYKFDVDILTKNTTKQNILEKFEEFLNSSQEGDRAIIYFSGHGASENEYGFLVPTDGFSNNKHNTCIGFNYIEEWVEKMMTEKNVKHLLIILDACQSGLGVLSKSGSDSPIIELTKHPAAHMITAGLDDQEAHPNKKKKFSVFTKFLADGLTGSADYTKDNVITLTELLIYVQIMVSNYVEINYSKKQIPVMGKMKGSGEMVFIYR